MQLGKKVEKVIGRDRTTPAMGISKSMRTLENDRNFLRLKAKET